MGPPENHIRLADRSVRAARAHVGPQGRPALRRDRPREAAPASAPWAAPAPAPLGPFVKMFVRMHVRSFPALGRDLLDSTISRYIVNRRRSGSALTAARLRAAPTLGWLRAWSMSGLRQRGSADGDSDAGRRAMTTGRRGAGLRGEPERLQKVLAKAGLGSRRTCEQMIADGRVTVNGVVAQLGQRADGARDLIAVDGIPVPGREGMAYYLVNKPAGSYAPPRTPRAGLTVHDAGPARAPGLPRREPGHLVRRADRADQRRGPGLPAHPPELRRAEGVRGGGRGHAVARGARPVAPGGASWTTG